MELSGEHRIAAPRSVVWQALHDPAILKDCIKGCKRLEMTGDDRMVATVEAKVGPVKATFDATVAIENSVAPERYTLTGEGKGGVAGFAKGAADVELAEDGPDATILTFKADAKIGGKLAQLGQRLVDTTARKYAADFFDAFSQKLNAGAPATAAVPGTDTAAVPAGLDAAAAAAEAAALEAVEVADGDAAAAMAAREASGMSRVLPETAAAAAAGVAMPSPAIAPTATPVVAQPVRPASPVPPHAAREAARTGGSGAGRILVAVVIVAVVAAAVYYFAF